MPTRPRGDFTSSLRASPRAVESSCLTSAGSRAWASETGEAGDDWLAGWTTELRLPVPGRDTLVAAELRRQIRSGHAARLAEVSEAMVAETAAPAVPTRSRAADPVRPAAAATLAQMRRPQLDFSVWAPPGRNASDPRLEPDWLTRAERWKQVREAARLYRAGELAEALRRGQPGLADAVAAALHDGAIASGLPAPIEGTLAKDGQTVHLDGDLRAAVAIARWVRSIVPPQQALIFYDEGFSADVALTGDVTEDELVRPFESA